MTPEERQTLIASLSSIQAAQLTVWGEARNQIVMGIVGVLSVIRNRVTNGHWGTWSQVCLAPEQFSCWNDGDPNQPKLLELASCFATRTPLPYDPILSVCGVLAQMAVNGELKDPTGGAMFYFNPLTVTTPSWAKAPAVRTTVIGAHAFYSGVRV
jgi:spore germination cell wall hydrolase CwlJ-like protein